MMLKTFQTWLLRKLGVADTRQVEYANTAIARLSSNHYQLNDLIEDLTEKVESLKTAQVWGSESPSQPETQPALPWQFKSTKRYDHNEGLSCCFRQWRADSHCNLLHGYALAFTFVFECQTLDDKNWCYDFGGLKSLKSFLHDTFDHTLAIAQDDPQVDILCSLDAAGIASIRVMPSVGCEAFAKYAGEYADHFVQNTSGGRVRLHSCEVREHSGNSAIWEPVHA